MNIILTATVPDGATVHALKTLPEYFEVVLSGEKTFEVRKNDRDFKVGDTLHLLEYQFSEFGNGYTGRGCLRQIDYILPGGQFGIGFGYVVLGICVPDYL